MKREAHFIREVYTNRFLIAQLVARDFKSRYAGSMLGLVWSFLQPLAMMAILIFVFTFGLKSQPAEPGFKFIPWFFSANVAWNFFQDSIFVSSNAVTDYAFLVRKVDFRVRLLPLVKILSALILHGIFLVLLVLILLFSGLTPQWIWLQAFYYLFCAVALLLGTGWLLSALSVFARDVGQAVAILMQLGFWMTPIIWNWRSLPEKYQPLVRLNPIFYITEGYRNTFVYGLSVRTQGLMAMLCFWAFTGVMLWAGHATFQKLRPHFGDVL